MAKDKKIEITSDEELNIDEKELEALAEDEKAEASDKTDESTEDEAPEESAETSDDESIDLKEEDEPIEDEVIDESEAEDEEPSDNTEKSENLEEQAKDENEEVDELLKLEREEAPPADPHAAQAAAASAAKVEDKERKALRHPVIAKIKSGFRYWWTHTKLRNATFVALFLGVVALAAIPASRYAALNLFGMRVGATVTVTNQESGLPLENIPVRLADKEVRTNEEGEAVFSDMKLGNTSLVINKLGYAEVDRSVTLGLGSNPGVRQEIVATGAQYRFSLRQWLSDDARIVDAKAQSGEDIARVNDEGELLLIISDLSAEATVEITADGYRTETIPVSQLEQELTNVAMVPDYRHAFVSNRSGEYDLFAIDLDAQNEELVLKASGKEREIPFAVQNDDGSRIAYISSRDGEENSGGFILDGLFVIENGEEKRVARSEQLQIIGWQGDNLVYVGVVEGVSAGNPQRSKVFVYNAATTERNELASSNYFNDVELIGDKVYYSVSSFAVPRSQAKLYSIELNGDNKQQVVDAQVWTIGYRDTNTLLLSAEDRKWYEQHLGSGEVSELEQAPAVNATRDYEFYGDSALRVESRDGKGTILLTDSEGNETSVLAEAGISVPIKWINENYAVYRITTGSESADYAVRLDNGKTQKIIDVVGNRSRYFY